MRSLRLTILPIALFAAGCGQKSTDQLVKNLKAPEAVTRIQAARTLPDRKADAAVVIPALVDALKDAHSDVRRSAATGLGSFGEQAHSAIPALQASLRDREPSVRKASAKALFQIDPAKFPDPAKIAK